jgi:hypothetical protein
VLLRQPLLSVSGLLLLELAATLGADATPPPIEHFVGVEYGTSDNLPLPHRGIELARSAGAAAVHCYDANELIPSMAASQRTTDA